MARYRHTEAESGQGLFLSVNLKDQLLPGSFEYMLDELIENKIDISVFDMKYKNDHTGAKAIPPKALLKLVIYGYNKGRNSSRGIWELSRSNIIAKALTGDMEIHWTTIADFISGNGKEFKDVFVKVLIYCNELGLIGGETLAIDGLRLPSNASMSLSGKKEQLEKRAAMYRRMADKHLEKHKRKDANKETDGKTKENFIKQQKKLNRQIEKISAFVETMEKKEGYRGKEIQSNVTDNESAIIHSSSGYLQGYIGIAVADKKEQIIVGAKAFGSANEGDHFPEMLEQCRENITASSGKDAWGKGNMTFLGDKNYFSENNLRVCGKMGVEVLIPDSQSKRRLDSNKERRYEAEDFKHNTEENYYECPQGKKLLYKGEGINNKEEVKYYSASVKDCRICPVYKKCIRSNRDQKTSDKGKNLVIRKSNGLDSLCRKMTRKFEMKKYQDLYDQRMGIIEPVFANIGYCKGLNRFSLRGKEKVDGQWQLYCIVHNLGKCLNEFNIRSSA